MTSSLATLYCLPPVRITAYMGEGAFAGSVVSVAWKLERTGKTPVRGGGHYSRNASQVNDFGGPAGCGAGAPGLVSAAFRKDRRIAPAPTETDRGEVPERSIGAVSKTVVPFTGYRGFESLPLRHRS